MDNQQQDADRKAKPLPENDLASAPPESAKASESTSATESASITESASAESTVNEPKAKMSATHSQSTPAAEKRTASTSASAAPQPSRDTPRHSRTGSSWSMRLAVLIALAMGGGALAGGYYLYQGLLTQLQTTKVLEEQTSQALKQPLARIEQLEQRQQQIAQLERELGRLTQDQSAFERQLTNLAHKTPSNWLIAEADYLVRMASRKLWLEQDPTLTLSLLKAADERIAALQDPALLPLRKALAADMMQVAALRTLDIAANVYALDAIIKAVNQLTPGRNQTEFTPQERVELSDSIDDWRSNLAKTWHAMIDDFVVVRKRSGDIMPLLPADQAWYLEENIRAKLLQAQLALYRHDEAAFRAALTMAKDWITEYFSLEQGSGAEVMASLNKLLALKFDTVPAGKFQASDMLRILMQDGLNPQLPAVAPASPSSVPIPAPNPAPAVSLDTPITSEPTPAPIPATETPATAEPAKAPMAEPQDPVSKPHDQATEPVPAPGTQLDSGGYRV